MLLVITLLKAQLPLLLVKSALIAIVTHAAELVQVPVQNALRPISFPVESVLQHVALLIV